MSGRRRLTVRLGERSYDVVVGSGAIADLPTLLPSGTRRAALVTQAGIPVAVDLGEAIAVERFEIGRGEQHKSLATIEQLTRGFARMGLTRHDVVIGVGGGMVTDVAGFAAATWHRGVAVVHVATTLLGMVDAAIGGKTGVNLPEGKNLVGAFWQPSGVVCDVDTLGSLPARERRSGDGEMAKYHFLSGDDLNALDLTDRVARCVQLKADVVAADEREGGRRALLNYGHTLAHALEIATDHTLTHGEAVGIGLVYAAELARLLGRVDDDRVAAHRRVVGAEYALDTAIPPGIDPERLIELMGRDKKALGDGLTFVLDGAAGVEVVTG
ncbi:MAG: 3-dehydroquinate synthase family protein, partial [Desertimonas sp.]